MEDEIREINYGKPVLLVVDDAREVLRQSSDFISEPVKFWDRLKTVAEANNCVPNTARLLAFIRHQEVHNDFVSQGGKLWDRLRGQ